MRPDACPTRTRGGAWLLGPFPCEIWASSSGARRGRSWIVMQCVVRGGDVGGFGAPLLGPFPCEIWASSLGIFS
jgi:hypothetical protein